MIRITILAASTLLSLSACIHTHSSHPLGGPPGQVRSAHVHCAGCGHALVDGVWIEVGVNHSSSSWSAKGHGKK